MFINEMTEIGMMNPEYEAWIEACDGVEIAQINNKDSSKSPLSPDKYICYIRNNEESICPPHFHIRCLTEGWEIKVNIANGELHQIINAGNRSEGNKFVDIIVLAKEWLQLLSTVYGMTDKKNYEVCIIQWRLLNPNNNVVCHPIWNK